MNNELKEKIDNQIKSLTELVTDLKNSQDYQVFIIAGGLYLGSGIYYLVQGVNEDVFTLVDLIDSCLIIENGNRNRIYQKLRENRCVLHGKILDHIDLTRQKNK